MSELEEILSDIRTDGSSVEILQTDGGTELKGEFEAIYERMYIKRKPSPLTPPSTTAAWRRALPC